MKVIDRATAQRKTGWLKLWGPIILVMVAGCVLAPWLVGPSCPKTVVIATGGPDGAYFAFAQRYREILAKDGITLEVRNTAGSVQNAELLRADQSDVSLAIIQGGTSAENSTQQIESLASLYHEPIWVFYRSDSRVSQLTELAGKRLALGPDGSGTRAVALELLRANDITVPKQAQTELGGQAAAQALLRDEVDAAFFAISPDSPIIQQLLQAEDVQLMSFRRAQAYQSRYPFLSSVTLSEGMLDLEHNIPAHDITLLAPTANLAARSDLHPALVPLLLKAATEVHEAGNLFDHAGEFPSQMNVEFPLNTNAKRFLTSGPTFLYRHLPFGLAAWIDQVKLVLLPFCTLLLPFVKVFPPVYRWRIRSKIYRWYRVLREIDQRIKENGTATDTAADIAKLRKMDDELAEVSVPLSYMEEFYNLRLHTAFVLDQLRQIEESTQLTLKIAA